VHKRNGAYFQQWYGVGNCGHSHPRSLTHSLTHSLPNATRSLFIISCDQSNRVEWWRTTCTRQRRQWGSSNWEQRRPTRATSTSWWVAAHSLTTHSLTHSLTQILTLHYLRTRHSSTLSLNQSINQSHTCTHSLTHSHTHSLTHSFTHSPILSVHCRWWVTGVASLSPLTPLLDKEQWRRPWEEWLRTCPLRQCWRWAIISILVCEWVSEWVSEWVLIHVLYECIYEYGM
jgi:hypothetical protein